MSGPLPVPKAGKVVATYCDSNTPGCRYVLRPNRSLTARGATFFLVSLLVVYLAIGIPLALVGLWLILPFAGLELLAVGGCVYVAMGRSARCEVVSVDDQTVVVESGRQRPERRSEFKRAWVQVRLQTSGHRWYPSRLTIGSHGKLIEIGAFLNEDERRRFAKELALQLRSAE